MCIRDRHGVGHDVPHHAGAGLDLEAGEVVVLELRAEGEGEVVGHQTEGVLQEGAVDVVGLLMGLEVDGGEGLDEVAGAEAQARAPDEVLVGQHGEAIDEVEIEGGSSLSLIHI